MAQDSAIFGEDGSLVSQIFLTQYRVPNANPQDGTEILRATSNVTSVSESYKQTHQITSQPASSSQPVITATLESQFVSGIYASPSQPTTRLYESATSQLANYHTLTVQPTDFQGTNPSNNYSDPLIGLCLTGLLVFGASVLVAGKARQKGRGFQ